MTLVVAAHVGPALEFGRAQAVQRPTPILYAASWRFIARERHTRQMRTPS